MANNSTSSMPDFKKYEDELAGSICAILLGLGAKGLMKRELLPVSSARKIVESFLLITVAGILGKELTIKLKKDGYLS